MPASAISGTIQNDLLKEYIARGTYIYPPKPRMRIITNIFEYCAQHVPKWNTITHQRLPHPRSRQHGGAGDRVHHRQRHRLRRCGHRRRPRRRCVRTAAQLLLERAQQLLRRGRQVPCLAPHLVPPDDRALRRARRRASKLLRFHTQTGGSTLTAQQPENNIVRVAVQTHGRGDGRHAEPAHQRLRRGAQPAHRASRAHRAAHAADHRLRERHRRHARPAGRQLLRRDAHRRGRAPGVGVHRPHRRDGRRRRGHRGRLPAGRDRAGRVRVREEHRRRRAGHRRPQQVHGRQRARARRVPRATRRSSGASRHGSRRSRPTATRRWCRPRLATICRGRAAARRTCCTR